MIMIGIFVSCTFGTGKQLLNNVRFVAVAIAAQV